MASYFTVVTDYGIKEMLKAIKEETKVNITKFAVGDGGGSGCMPSTGQMGLVNEVWRGAVNTCYINGDSENLLIVESVIPSDIGGFTIREMGLFDDKGGMIAVCNTPDTQKVKVSDGVVHELNLSMELALTNTDSVQLVVDPNVVVATKKDLEQVAAKAEAAKTAADKHEEKLAWFWNCGNRKTDVEKSVDADGFQLSQGARIVVHFIYGNTAENITLNVNNTGAAPVCYNGAAIPADYIRSGHMIEFVYYGNSWNVVGDLTQAQVDELNIKANTASNIASNAYTQANNAYGRANSAYTQANNAYSRANSAYTQANNAYSRANSAYTQANTASNTAVNAYTQANNAYSRANIASNTASSLNTSLYGSNNTVIGKNATANDYSTALGSYAAANGSYSTALGYYAKTSGDYSTALGQSATASGTGSTALGYSATASGNYSTALGYSATANDYSTSLGRNAIASGINSTALGYYAKTSGDYSTALGYYAIASGTGSTALGYYATANNYSTALGQRATASGSDSTALGSYAAAIGNNSTALGQSATASGNNSTALGYGATANDYSTALGRNATASGNYSTALGYGAAANGNYSTALGYGATANDYSTSLGRNAIASGINSTALGSYTTANGNNSMSLGYKAKANGSDSTALGYLAEVPNTKSNTIQLGSASSLSELSCRVSLTVTSDERDKADIAEVGDGVLEFLRKIKAIRYVFNGRELYIDEETLSKEEKEKKSKYGLCAYDKEAHEKGTKKGSRMRIGVSAQEVQKALKEVFGDSGYANLVNDNLFDLDRSKIPDGVENQLSVNYEGFIPFLIKAVNEMCVRLERLERGA